MKQYKKQDNPLSIKNHSYMSNFFPFYGNYEDKYIDRGTRDEVEDFDERLNLFILEVRKITNK